MNDLNARAIPYQGQFLGQFRRVHKPAWETVKENGEPILFPVASEAEVAAWRVLRVHMGEVLGYRGEIVSPRERAEQEFQKVMRHGEGKSASCSGE